jgi:methionyl-tRNA formyltransferase
MRLLFMGSPGFALPALEALAARHEVVAVYTQPPRPAGRGQATRPSAVERRARELGLGVRHPATLRDPAAQAEFAAFGADCAVVVAYGLILPPAVLASPRLGCLNIHASLLPRWRGAAPIHRAILAGDAETGVAIMQMAEGLDTGPVILEQRTPIGPAETTGDLHDRLAAMGAGLIVEALDRIGALRPVPQAESGVTYAAKIDKAEARIDWARPAEAVARQVRALSPAPGAWCLSGSERMRILRAHPVASGGGAPAGTILPGAGLTVACATGALVIDEAQREGRKPMATEVLMRGFAPPARFD